MKRILLPTLAALVAAIAQAAPADDVSAAARKLADAPNYSWTRTQETVNSQFNPGPTEGMTEKGGFTVTTASFNDMKFQTVRKGEQSVYSGQDGTWMTAEERRAAAQGGGGGRGGRGGGGFGGAGQINPAEDLAALVAQSKNLKVADGAIVGDLSDEGATQRLSFGGRGGRGGGGGGEAPPPPKNVSGSVKYWLKDGAITKYQIRVKGIVTGRNGETERDQTTTTELKNVGSTKITVPDEAKKKLG